MLSSALFLLPKENDLLKPGMETNNANTAIQAFFDHKRAKNKKISTL